MSTPKLRCYQYINRPYEQVRVALHAKAATLLQGATRVASARADELATTLHVGMPGFEVGVDVKISVQEIKDEQAPALKSAVTRVTLAWEATRAAALFPSMKAVLSAWPLSSTETQLEIDGNYKPPMGAVGEALDSVVGHRIAEAAVHRLLEEVIDNLRREIPGK